MTDPLNYTGRLKAKGLDNTGVTEEITRAMANSLGNSSTLIIEVVHDEVTKKADGTQQVKLAIASVVPVPKQSRDVIQRLARSIHESNPIADGQAVLKGTTTSRSVEEATAEVAAHIDPAKGDKPETVWDGDTDGPLEPASTDGGDGDGWSDGYPEGGGDPGDDAGDEGDGGDDDGDADAEPDPAPPTNLATFSARARG